MTLTGNITLIHSFFYVDGFCPTAGLVQASDGNFYGTTRNGGPFDAGSIFRISPSGSFSVLHWFNGADGRWPVAALSIGSAGALYGTTTNGYSAATGYFAGTVFRITTTGAFAELHNFGDAFALFSVGGVVEGPDGNIYGSKSGGTFRIGPGTTFTTLQQGVSPNVGSMTRVAGGAMQGAFPDRIFRLTVDGGLTSFAFPSGVLTDGPIEGSDGNFYGTSAGTCFGDCGSAPGLLYSMTPSGVFTTLHSFTGDDGALPWGRMVQAGDGAFYGATFNGGPAGAGVVYRMTVP
jgi:uncharacterized repeat protein (TIGR03803 family)